MTYLSYDVPFHVIFYILHFISNIDKIKLFMSQYQLEY